VDLRYIVFFLLIKIKGIFETLNPAVPFCYLEQFVITILISMVILLIWFHHLDTILVVLLVCLKLTLYLKLPY